MINNPSGIKIFKAEAIKYSSANSNFSYEEREGNFLISGDLFLNDELGNILDSYLIEIHCSEKYPYKFPVVFEKGGKLPKNIDWHVFENDGRCCIKTIPEEILICHKGISLTEFIEKEIKPYFFNQTFRRLNGYYLKERSHGIASSSIEFFSEILLTQNLDQIIKMLSVITNRTELKSTGKCICGSNRKYKKCHRRSFRELSKIPSHILSSFLSEIKIFKLALDQSN